MRTMSSAARNLRPTSMVGQYSRLFSQEALFTRPDRSRNAGT
jgi:hypothetical protein